MRWHFACKKAQQPQQLCPFPVRPSQTPVPCRAACQKFDECLSSSAACQRTNGGREGVRGGSGASGTAFGYWITYRLSPRLSHSSFECSAFALILALFFSTALFWVFPLWGKFQWRGDKGWEQQPPTKMKLSLVGDICKMCKVQCRLQLI